MERAALQIAILLSSGLLLAACGGRKDSIVPAATPAQPPAASRIYIVVQRGQTLDALAERFRIDRAEIIALNNLKPPYMLKPGAVLQIPALPAALEQEEQTIEPAAHAPPPATAAAAPARPARPKPQPKPMTP